jgi:hypothetical protein
LLGISLDAVPLDPAAIGKLWLLRSAISPMRN